MPEGVWAPRRLDIKSCTETYSGTNTKGPYSIYEIKATNEQGVLINHKLSSFSQLPLGPGDYEVSAYPPGSKPGDQNFRNFTVRPKDRKGSNTGALRSDLDLLTQKVEWLTERVNTLGPAVEELQRRLMEGGGPPSQPPAGSATGSPPDDDIPF
jgi:hypothetical protein